MRGSTFLLSAVAIVATRSTALTAAPRATVEPWGVELSYIDTSVKPGDDFFQYANGNWMKTDVIPADRTYSGAGLEVDRQNEARLKGLVTDLAAKPDAELTPEQRKLRDLYAAFMDTKQIAANGLAPAQANLATIAGIHCLSDVARAIGDPTLGLDGPYT